MRQLTTYSFPMGTVYPMDIGWIFHDLWSHSFVAGFDVGTIPARQPPSQLQQNASQVPTPQQGVGSPPPYGQLPANEKKVSQWSGQLTNIFTQIRRALTSRDENPPKSERIIGNTKTLTVVRFLFIQVGHVTVEFQLIGPRWCHSFHCRFRHLRKLIFIWILRVALTLSSKIEFYCWPLSTGHVATGMRHEWKSWRRLKACDFDGVYSTAKWSKRLEH